VLSLAWLGHSTVVIDLDDVRVVADPLLHPHAGLLRRWSEHPGDEHWRDAHGVLLSHMHHDHAHLSSLRLLRDVPIYTAEESAAWLRRKGLHRAVGLRQLVSAVDGWTRLPGSEVEVGLVEAVHHSRPMPFRPNAANGHLLRGSDTGVWVAGDTSLFAGMNDLPDLLGRSVDLAVVPVGGWGPRLSPGHMDPAQAALACATVGARWALPVHWGTLHPPLFQHFGTSWLQDPGERFVRALQHHAPQCTPVVLRPGESTRVRVGTDA
jgi:L-ascorbate metabolism protein UlaG (beta-lactamase superfamily)